MYSLVKDVTSVPLASLDGETMSWHSGSVKLRFLQMEYIAWVILVGGGLRILLQMCFFPIVYFPLCLI